MKKRLYLLLTVLGAALAVLVVTGVAGMRRAESAPPSIPENLLYCGTCHSMEQEVSTWQKGPHSSVSCLQCHDESDVAWVKHELGDLGDTMASSEQKKAQHAIPLKAPDARCEECHADQMKDVMADITPAPMLAKADGTVGKPMAIKAAHAVHTEKVGLSCAECHTDSAHGTQLTADQQREQWHDKCMSCHVEKQVKIAVIASTSCAACHTDVTSVTPADHKDQAVWQRSHGKATETQACGSCHLAESAGAHSPVARPESFPSAVKDSCTACHSGVAMPHPDTFLSTHGKVSMKVKDGTCEACHKADSTAAPNSGAAASCTSCHAQPMPHPASFLSYHGRDAQKAPATCAACHSSKNVANPTAPHSNPGYCMSCHDSYQHQAGWVVSHGTQVDNSCTTCHTTKGETGTHNACAACHTPSGEWHPDLWFVKHGREVEAQGKQACMTCHGEVQPSCTQCHRNP
jgi:hypothetical protein